jgi:hypothetical protein
MRRVYYHRKQAIPDLTDELRKESAKAKLKELRRMSVTNRNVREWFNAVRSTGQALSFLTEAEFDSLVLQFQNEARINLASQKERAILRRQAEQDFRELFERKADEFDVLTNHRYRPMPDPEPPKRNRDTIFG